MRQIRITAGQVSTIAELNDSPTANAIWDALPLTARGSRWGKEIYFGIPVTVADPAKKAVVQKGDLGYWDPGSAFCIFWGPTPASRGEEIRPASPVSVFGKITGDASVFDPLPSSVTVKVERA